jgi:hypothetical protein
VRCIRPIKASQRPDGTICFTLNESVGLVPFEFECRKCLPCRLNIAREKAIRCVHEARMHDESIFLTLTYNEESLESPKLQYTDFQEFIRKLRYERDEKISYMVTGEYGDKNKRPHWHAIMFGFRPEDSQYKYTSDRGDKVFTSESIRKLWGRGAIEYGDVTMDSAGYVARYAAKKLVHGRDQDHEYHPIHKSSSKRAIGKSWIEKYWKHTFRNGYVTIPGQDGIMKIPRYYVDWLKKENTKEYVRYVTEVRPKIMQKMEEKVRREEMEYFSQVWSRKHGQPVMSTRSRVKLKVLESKFKNLQERLKL